MARAAHPDSMKPSTPGATRTAPPMLPHQFPMTGRYKAYTLFDATGLVYLLAGFVALRAVRALVAGPAAWAAFQQDMQHPLYVAFHLVTLISVVFVGVRFFRLFPKAQPTRVGGVRLPLPPAPVIHASMYVAWIAVAGLFAAILAGRVF
jgi:fumarate reductase subunit C